jgi:cytochrome c-type biogenesis protein CcmE
MRKWRWQATMIGVGVGLVVALVGGVLVLIGSLFLDALGLIAGQTGTGTGLRIGGLIVIGCLATTMGVLSGSRLLRRRQAEAATRLWGPHDPA